MAPATNRLGLGHADSPGLAWLGHSNLVCSEPGVSVGRRAHGSRGPSISVLTTDYRLADHIAFADSSPPSSNRTSDIEGGHFGLLYHPSDLFDESSTVQAAYLTGHHLP